MIESIETASFHSFSAIAFVENFTLRELAGVFPGARITPTELHSKLDAGDLFVFPFGAIVFHQVPPEARERELSRILSAMPSLTTRVVREDFAVREDPRARIGVVDGALVLDRVTPQRAGVVALIVGQSAAMEYYERIVERLVQRTNSLVERLESRGTVPARTRPLHRFIGEAIVTRTEVLSVLHLLDKPDAVWEDAALDRIYDDLRAEFDLADRYRSLELKLGGVQEALELVLDVARDRRLVLLEVAIVALIVIEIILAFAGWM